MLINAIALLHGVHLAVVGDGEERPALVGRLGPAGWATVSISSDGGLICPRR